MTTLDQFLGSAPFPALRHSLSDRIEAVIQEAIAIQQIPAPTFGEARRAEYVMKQLAAIPTLDSHHTDALFNVYARLPGTRTDRPGVLVAAHTDTVFGLQTVLDYRRGDGVLHGPGIGDNSLGVAALIAAAELLSMHPWPVDIWFVANTREEGLGDLGGIRAAYDRLRGKLARAIIIEGMALGRVYHAGIAVRRLRITCRGEGGHSWVHFGRSSAVHGLISLGAQIVALRPPEAPRTTYNVGVIEGGTTVNTIASQASFLLDMRSESLDALAALERTVLAMVEGARASDLKFEIELVGDRPAGSIPRTHPLVRVANDILASVDLTASLESGSTDANALLAYGLPTVTVGITQGGNTHRLDEYIELGNIPRGMWQLLMLVGAAAAGWADTTP